VITPTYGREQFLPQILACFLSQDYPHIEWQVLDDSPQPAECMRDLQLANVHYEHVPVRLSIGEKRNQLVARASGELIVHFDDDDFYAPDYVSTMVAQLQQRNADMLNLRGWFLFDRRTQFFGYWDLTVKEGIHFICSQQGTKLTLLTQENNAAMATNHLGYGFGWIYRKRVWGSIKFPDINFNEDGEFAARAQQSFRLDGVQDKHGICLHVLHLTNTSRCFAQYRLPLFALRTYFPSLQLIDETARVAPHAEG
jgi:glycosyltransferase involved in cell wall biosynthesis